MDTKRVGSLDLIRALSVLMIIIFHFCVYALYKYKIDVNISRYMFPFFGGLGVSFFIVISGGANAINSAKSTSTISFYIKRASSIFPCYYVAYCTTALLLFIFTGNTIFHGESLKIAYTVIGLDGFLSQRFSTYYLIGEWFLGFIIIIYAIFPLILFFYKKNRFVTFIVSIIISVLTIHYNSQLCDYFPFWNKRDIWNPLARLPEFIFGMMLYEAIKEGRFRELSVFYILSILIIAGYALHNRHDMVVNEHRNIPLFLSCAAFVSISFEYLAKFMHDLSIIKFFSKYSFMAFLYHHQVLSFITSKIHLPNDKVSLFAYAIYIISISFALAYMTYGAASRLQAKFHYAFNKALMKKSDE